MLWFVFLFSTAQAKKQKRPCWITAACPPYSSEEYIIGVGSGSNIQEADNAAIGAISKQFVVTITQRQDSQKEITETKRQGSNISQLEHHSLRTKTDVETMMSLSGITIAEHFEEPKSDIIYSLAVISKKKWLDSIHSERRTLQEQMQELKLELLQESHFLDRIPYYTKLDPIAEQEEWLYKQETIIAPTQTPFPLAVDRGSLRLQKQRERESFYFVINKSDDCTIEPLLYDSFQKMGFAVSKQPQEESGLLLVSCHDRTETNGPNVYGFYTAQNTFSIEIATPQRTRKTIAHVATSASRDPQKAEKNLQATIMSEIQKDNATLLELLGDGT